MAIKLGVMGPPGAGKGTQGERIARFLSIPNISTGDIFRQAVKEKTPLGKTAREYMTKGELVPDDVVWGIVEVRLQESDCTDGFILDGFPRTVGQAELLNESPHAPQMMISITVPDWEVVQRITSRRICRNCGSTHSVQSLAPDAQTVCPKCGGELYIRSDDAVDTVRERLRVYKEATAPLISYYAKREILRKVDGVGGPDQVFCRIEDVLQELQHG